MTHSTSSLLRRALPKLALVGPGIAIGLAIGWTIGCSARPGAAAATLATEPDPVRAVGAVLDDWHDAAAHSDEARYFAHFAADGVFLGTDATERWDVAAFRAYASPRFAEGKGWSMRATSRHVVVAGDGRTAWFDEALETRNLGPARGSGVLVRGDSARWTIALYVLSITVPNPRFAAVKALLEAP